MDVDQPAGKTRHKAGRQDAHETRQHHQRRLAPVDQTAWASALSKASRDVNALWSTTSVAMPCSRQPKSALCIGRLLITAATGRPASRQLSRCAVLHDGCHVGAAARDQNDDVLHVLRIMTLPPP
jgi:hypothetical protein